MRRLTLFTVAVALAACTTDNTPIENAPTQTLATFGSVTGGGTTARSLGGQPPLTISELVDCMDLRLAIERDEVQVRSTSINLSTRRTALETESQLLDTQRLLVDATNQASVNSFNASLTALRSKQDTYNRDVVLHNSRIDSARETLQSFNTMCAGKSYLVDDLRRMLIIISGRATDEDRVLLEMIFPASF